MGSFTDWLSLGPQTNAMNTPLQHIFLVDDDRSINYYHKWMLEGMNIANTISIFSDGDEAWKAVTEMRDKGEPGPELILLDVNMPGMNGLEFQRQYTNTFPQQEQAKVVFLLSSPLLQEEKEEAIQLGIRHHLDKPLDEKILEGVLAQMA